MSKEEKKAIEIIKKEITKPETTPLEVYVTDIKMLLNIIDKQQKEIEKQRNRIEHLKKDKNILYDIIDDLERQIESLLSTRNY